MSEANHDQFVVIRVSGMHCHKCEQRIVSALRALDGVREVEVDFASGQASVLFDRDLVGVGQLMESIREAGYATQGFTQGQSEPVDG